MALEGKLVADFSSFYDAVDKAAVKFRSFEDDASKVEKRLNTVTDGFTGRRVIQEATLMAEAIERAGGTSVLTESELRRVGATAAEAAAKMKLLGIDVPPGIQKIADEAHKTDQAFGGMTNTVKQLALGFAGMFTARAAFNFAKDTINEASALADLSNQTHINVEELQVLAGAMSEFGVDADTLAKGLYTLSRKVAGGDESVEKALAKMGMSMQELDGLNGQELFLKIEHGLSRLQGGMRDDVSAEIFGSKLGMAMAGASEDIEGAIATWREHNTVVSKDAVAALDAYDESIKRAEKSLQGMVANALGPLAEGFNYLNDTATKGASGWAFLKANLLDTFDAVTGLGTGTEHLASLMDEMNQKTKQQADAGRESTEVVIDQNESLSVSARAWNAMAAGIDAAEQSSVIYGEGLPVEAQQQMNDAVKAGTEDEAAYRLNVKFTSEALDERAASLKRIQSAADEAKAANDAFMNASTLNDRVSSSNSGDLPALNGNALDDVVSRFHQAGDTNSSQALNRALQTLSEAEGRYAPKNNVEFFQMQRDTALLAQLRQLQGNGTIPGFANGVEDFSGGLAYVHRDEMLVNMPKGTSVIPAGRGGGGGHTFHVTISANSRRDGENAGAAFISYLKSVGELLPN